MKKALLEFRGEPYHTQVQFGTLPKSEFCALLAATPMTARQAMNRSRPTAPTTASGSAATEDQLCSMQKRLDQQAHQVTSLKRERESLLRLVIGMAVDSYRYNPKEVRRSRSVAKIANSLRVIGAPLDEGTILNLLRHGAELLPDDE